MIFNDDAKIAHGKSGSDADEPGRPVEQRLAVVHRRAGALVREDRLLLAGEGLAGALKVWR